MKKRTVDEVNTLLPNAEMQLGMLPWQRAEIATARKNLLAGMPIPKKAVHLLALGGRLCRLENANEWELVFPPGLTFDDVKPALEEMGLQPGDIYRIKK